MAASVVSSATVGASETAAALVSASVAAPAVVSRSLFLQVQCQEQKKKMKNITLQQLPLLWLLLRKFLLRT